MSDSLHIITDLFSVSRTNHIKVKSISHRKCLRRALEMELLLLQNGAKQIICLCTFEYQTKNFLVRKKQKVTVKRLEKMFA